MNTSGHAIPNWVLGSVRRCVRGTIGAAALLGVLLIPSLSEGWLFVLAMIGGYESLTAILDADLVYGMLNLDAVVPPTRHAESEEGIRTTPLITRDELQRYQTVA